MEVKERNGNVSDDLARDREDYRLYSQQLKGLDEQRDALSRKLQAIRTRWPDHFRDERGRRDRLDKRG